MKKFRNIMWGIVLVIIGLVIGTNSIGLTDIDIFFDGWWTLIIIIPCFIGIFNDKDKVGNIIGLVIGVALLLACQDVVDFEIIWKLFLPTILVGIGLSIIFKDSISGKIQNEIRKLNQNKKGDQEYCATFSSQNVNFDGDKFTGADITAVFGGVKCDLYKAIIDSDVVINISSIFGGVDVIVPNDINVKIKSTSIFGGVSNKKDHSDKNDKPTIYINANCLFGGVEIK